MVGKIMFRFISVWEETPNFVLFRFDIWDKIYEITLNQNMNTLKTQLNQYYLAFLKIIDTVYMI